MTQAERIDTVAGALFRGEWTGEVLAQAEDPGL